MGGLSTYDLEGPLHEDETVHGEFSHPRDRILMMYLFTWLYMWLNVWNLIYGALRAHVSYKKHLN